MIPDSVKERILDADIKKVIEAEGIALQRSGGLVKAMTAKEGASHGL